MVKTLLVRHLSHWHSSVTLMTASMATMAMVQMMFSTWDSQPRMLFLEIRLIGKQVTPMPLKTVSRTSVTNWLLDFKYRCCIKTGP